MKLLEILVNELISNQGDFVNITVPDHLSPNELSIDSLDLKLKTNGVANFGGVKIPKLTIVGSKDDYRKLGLLLILRGLCANVRECFYIKTIQRPWTDINGLCIGGAGLLPLVSGLEVKSVIYRSGSWESPPILPMNVDQWGLPGFGFLDTEDKYDPPNPIDRVPDWLKKAICIYGSSESCFFVGKLLLDFSHPNNHEITELKFDPMNRATKAASYIASFCLEGGLEDDDAYCG